MSKKGGNHQPKKPPKKKDIKAGDENIAKKGAPRSRYQAKKLSGMIQIREAPLQDEITKPRVHASNVFYRAEDDPKRIGRRRIVVTYGGENCEQLQSPPKWRW